MKIVIVNCQDPLMWYRNHVGEVHDVVRVHEDAFMVREPAGFLNIVRTDDATVIKEGE